MKRVNKDELINYNLCLSVLILVFLNGVLWAGHGNLQR